MTFRLRGAKTDCEADYWGIALEAIIRRVNVIDRMACMFLSVRMGAWYLYLIPCSDHDPRLCHHRGQLIARHQTQWIGHRSAR